jgi:hypothetical protein
MLSVFIFSGGVRLFFLCLVSNVTRVYLFGGVCVFFLCLVSNVLRVYLFWWGPCLLSAYYVQCYPCLSFLVRSVSSFCVLCPMLSVSIFFGGVRVFYRKKTRIPPKKIFTGNIGHKKQKEDTHFTKKDRHGFFGGIRAFCLCLVPLLPVYIFFDGVRVFFLCLVSNDTGVYLSVSCVQCYPCLSFFGGVRVYLSVSCVQCYPCLSFLVECVSSFCVLCPMLPVSIFFGGVCVLDKRHRKIDTNPTKKR